MPRTTAPLQLVWFRDDLRTADHPALTAAMAAGPAIAVYVFDEQSPGLRALGGAARWWLHHALLSLRESLAELGVPLVLRSGQAAEIVSTLAEDCGAQGIHWTRRYSEAEREVDALAKAKLRGAGREAHSYAGSLLHEPWELQTQEGNSYKVFTPFYNKLRDAELRPVLPAPEPQETANSLPDSEDLESWDLLPTNPDWSGGLAARWVPGEAEAHSRLEEVAESIAADYPQHHDRPDLDGTSALSPALRWGHLSPHQAWEALGRQSASNPGASEGVAAVRRQLAWRDFCWHLLYHHPSLPTQNLRGEFDAFDWAWPDDDLQAAAHVAAWQHGETGFRLVDAGMRQLWETGWMHNRVRMVTASLLVKNLGVHWKVGEQWFWDTLVDADLASNSANWQWVAGSGADAAPYFRVFNPELQAKKFDPQGSYVARFAPVAHEPIVDLKSSRAQALESYDHMKARHKG
ncbi:deoxyribodipyrimidine photo-lyase [Glutamicibacter soli]|uniref:Deoxyribodipyrimidine photo-lyase n=1 Tax=Glutamicibacter soli TaxID=453836 RepID=A0A6L9G4U3_9MICC|nr:deoxyribodipyrimidine photo-lyase [Glutamicibacter soli]NAZ16209.1 deoxyribodipyrimidine photo-lyase [Glutamicibacter soli]